MSASAPMVANGLATRACRCAAVAGAGLAIAAGAVYLRAVDPSTGGWFPPCPLRASTGIWCPGCGLTRATHHLLHGDVSTALRFNLFVVPVLAALGFVWFAWARSLLGRPTRPVAVSARWLAASLVVVLGFVVIRNLPGLEVLRGLSA